MRRHSPFILLIIIIIICVIFQKASSTNDYLNSPRIVNPNRYDAVHLAPARRSLLSDKDNDPKTALVAALNGTIYLLKDGSPKPLWSFSSGSAIYSSYQAQIMDMENISGVESSYFIDFGDDFEMYAHSSLGKLKLMKSVEEYINSTPQIAEDGGIVLGSKKTSVFLVDAKTGKVTYTYRMPDSSTSMHTSANEFLYNTVINEQYQSESDLKMDELPLYITRTDYRLTSFMPNSDKVLWNVTVAEIGAAFLCQNIEKSHGGIPSDHESSETGRLMPLTCQSRARVFRYRDDSKLQALFMPNRLPKPHQEDMMLPASTSDILPSQPNVEKVLKLRSSSHSSLEFLDAHDSQDLENYSLPNVPEVNVFADDNLTTPRGKFSTFLLFLFSLSLLVFVGCHHNIVSGILVMFSRIKVMLFRIIVMLGGTSSTDKHSKRKRSRKSGKGGSNIWKQDKEENEAKQTSKEIENNFWKNLNLPSSCSTDGRTIGKLFVSSKVIAKGSNGTIVLEGVYEGRPVAVKRLVRAYNDIAFKEIQNLIVSDRHPNIIRWYGVEQDQDFVYLALERGACSLNDLIFMQLKSSGISIPGKNLDDEIAAECRTSSDSSKPFMHDSELWKSDGYPSPLLLNLMRDVISGLAHLHELGIVHRDLKPQNVLIISERSLCAKLSDMGISKRLIGDMSSLTNHATGCGSSGWQAPEQLLHGRQTRAVDLFSLGCVLFFCITGGRHPFGSSLERDVNIANSKVDLFLVEHIPEAVDLFLRLLDPDAEMRPKAVEVLYHPLFWTAETRLSFLRDTSDRVELEDREIDSYLLKALESTVPLALGAKWNEKMEPSFLNNIGRYRRYKFDSVRDLLRVMRNKLNHYRELPAEIQEIIGAIPEGFDGYFTSRFPKLLIEVYKVMIKHCSTEEWFAKYLRGRSD